MALEIQATLNKALADAEKLRDDLDVAVAELSEKQLDAPAGQALEEQADTVGEIVDQIIAAEEAISGIQWPADEEQPSTARHVQPDHDPCDCVDRYFCSHE